MIYKYIALLASLSTPIVCLGNDSFKVIAGARSIHFVRVQREVMNQSHLSIGFEYKDVQVIYVDNNSYGEHSFYVSYAPDYELNDCFTLSANIGFATGYYDDNSIEKNGITISASGSSLYNSSGVIPLIGATISYHTPVEGFDLNATITPVVAIFTVSYDFSI